MKRCPQCGEHSVQRENHYTEWLEVCTSCGASQVLEEEAFKTGGGGTPRRTPQNEATGRGRPSWTGGGGGGGAATSSRRGINYYPKVSACRRELRRVLNTSLSKVSKNFEDIKMVGFLYAYSLAICESVSSIRRILGSTRSFSIRYLYVSSLFPLTAQ